MRNKIINHICTTFVVLSIAYTAQAQLDYEYIERKGWSLGINVGNSELWGDIGTKSPIAHFTNGEYTKNTMPFVGLYTRYVLDPSFVIRTGINYGTVAASDKMNADLAKKAEKYEDDAVQRFQRNLDVRVNIWEANLLFEVNPFRFSHISRMAHRHFQPYLLFGITGYHFQSKGRYINKVPGAAGSSNEQWINLYNLHIEGDGFAETGVKAYKQWQMAIPLGIGGKWDLSPKFAIGLEFQYRYCFTDYLDGVSGKYIDPKLYDKYLPQDANLARAMSDKSWELDPSNIHVPGQMRGSNKGKDAYSTLSITFFYKFKSRAMPWWL
ncbi:MAG: DUF6089 family protein [Phycisphaerales bacterium]|nr:DUF6089 family protein [Phycisphaerales bacterium]